MANISVVVPVYKVEQFLHRCVDSILCQSYEAFDLILVDDGSPDNCGKICEEYAEKDSRVHVIHQKNGGLSAARNTGIAWSIANSDSRWIAFVDSDDWVHPCFLEKLYSAAEKTLCRVSVCGLFRTSGDPLPEDPEEEPVAMSAEDYYCSQLHEGLTAVAWNKLYHKSLFKTLRYPIGKLHEDEFTTYQALYKAETVAVITARLYAYYQNPEGIMRSEWSPRRMDMLQAFEEQIAFAQKNGSPRLLSKTAEQYIYAVCDQLRKAGVIYHKELRNKLRYGLKLGRSTGCFPWGKNSVWAYELAYPVKPFWWVFNRVAWKK